jgi:transcriptional regulator with PAS, ATPase and Fis domain
VSEAARDLFDRAECPGTLLGDSPAIRLAVELARRFAPTRAPILLVGPTGTGKELLAHHIHAWSGRRGEMVDINCGALPRELVESTLFGHRRGAFSGAIETTTGLIEAANGGTLLLDELSSLPTEAQAKLLRVLESGTLRRIGETSGRRVDFRPVATLQKHPKFSGDSTTTIVRLDLLQRLAGVVIELPPLCERPGDIARLALSFAAEGRTSLSDAALAVLESYGWPGNVRELRAAVARAGWLSRDVAIDPDCMREAIVLGAVGLEQPSAPPDHAERAVLVTVCTAHEWHAGHSSRALGVSRTTLYRRLREAGVSLRSQKRLARLSPALAS